jgi:Fe-S-cluster-containing dehydrogenase component
MGVLVDLTDCIGCRACEAACAEANHLPDPDPDVDLTTAGPRYTTPTQYTVVSRYDTSKGEVFVKTQCMNCVSPACSTGCLTKALDKKPTGPVTWDGGKCLGCRLCMLSCPFEMPKAEYDSWNPKIAKCQLCFDRIKDGGQPACVENCGGSALTFGKRSELLEIARKKIYNNPGKYVSQIYGEDDVGGTSWLYISPVPFEQLGFPANLSSQPLPELTGAALEKIPGIVTIGGALLFGIWWITQRREEVARAEGRESSGQPAAAPAGASQPVLRRSASEEARHDR